MIHGLVEAGDSDVVARGRCRRNKVKLQSRSGLGGASVNVHVPATSELGGVLHQYAFSAHLICLSHAPKATDRATLVINFTYNICLHSIRA